MDVLHYSFSLSACPKCHLLVCMHTSLADLDFRSIEPQKSDKHPTVDSNTTTSTTIKTRYQRLSSHGMNFYILPSTTTSDNRHSWTTFGSDSSESTNTLEHSSLDRDTLCDDIPFANENIIHSSLPSKPTLNHIVRTQSERCPKNFKPHICLTKSYSFSTIYTTPKSLTLSPHIPIDKIQAEKLHSKFSILILIILIISYLLTNTFDIVLLYIYYQTNYVYFLIFLSTVFMCDIVLWINNLIERKTLASRLLFIPFLLRLYILYELVELTLIIFNRNLIDRTQLFDSSSTPSSSTTTTLETNLSQTTNSSLINHQPQQQQQQQTPSYKTMQRRIYHYLTLFYLIHSSVLLLVNLYFWSNNFHLSTSSTLNMDYLLPKWVTENDLLFSTSMNLIPVRSSIASYWQKLDHERKHLARRTMSSNWTRPIFYRQLPLSIRLPSSSIFILISISYHLIINYCLLATFLNLKRTSWVMIIISIFSRLCLIITRIYTFIFLFRLNAWWFAITFSIVHVSLMLTLLIDRSKLNDSRRRIFLHLIFSFLTHSSIHDVSINALISLENISIFLHRLYLETFSSPDETTLRLNIFISILISLQILGFLFDILSKNILYRTGTAAQQTVTKL